MPSKRAGLVAGPDAVVHIDGNEMADRFRDVLAVPGGDEAVKTALKKLSETVTDLGHEALREMMAKLEKNARLDENGRLAIRAKKGPSGRPSLRLQKIEQGPDVNKEAPEYYAPLRPIVYGGDDVTFVCDARIAHSAALAYVDAYEQLSAKEFGADKRVTQGVGICIVPSKYPFARAYAMAEQLCTSAKSFRREQRAPSSCIDWHIAQADLIGDLNVVRESYQTPDERRLTLRPLLYPNVDGVRSWETVRLGLEHFQSIEEGAGRNKALSLREALRDGEQLSKLYLKAYDPSLPGFANEEEGVFHGNVCTVFDALELIDIYIPLEEESATDAHD
jgi:hypothetical protein